MYVAAQYNVQGLYDAHLKIFVLSIKALIGLGSDYVQNHCLLVQTRPTGDAVNDHQALYPPSGITLWRSNWPDLVDLSKTWFSV